MTFCDSIRDGSVLPTSAGWPLLDAGSSKAVWRERLRSVVAQRIVPQLAAQGADVVRADAKRASAAEQAVALATSALRGSRAAEAEVDRWVSAGLSLEAFFLDILTPAARHLGDLWLSDGLSFLDVTRGSAVLQALVRRHAAAFEAPAMPGTIGGSILLAPVPGEQHVLGLSMLAAFFRRSGWHVVFEPQIDAETLVARLATEPFDAVGLSASGTRFVRRLPQLIERMRNASCAPGLRVLVGGALFVEPASFENDVGADAIARDAPEAVRLAEEMLARNDKSSIAA